MDEFAPGVLVNLTPDGPIPVNADTAATPVPGGKRGARVVSLPLFSSSFLYRGQNEKQERETDVLGEEKGGAAK